MRKLFVFSLLLVIAACSDSSAIIRDCESVGDRTPICGWQQPEDMALLPDGISLIVSEMANNHAVLAGSLSLLDSRDDSRYAMLWEIDPLMVSREGRAQTEVWGAIDCDVPPIDAFSPHGVHLSQRGDGRLQLLVVNHGGRESVEFFEVLSDGERYSLSWRGCTLAPEGAYFNDVVALPEGGFIVTHMYDRNAGSDLSKPGLAEVKMLLGLNPGGIWRWNKSGFQRMAFSGNFPNGIELSADGRFLFVNLWRDGLVQKWDLEQSELVAEVSVDFPDNLQWDGEGKLLVASQQLRLSDIISCSRLTQGACTSPFQILELDPETMSLRVLIEQNGAPMGNGTVAQRLGDRVYIGSYVGDRILRVPYPKSGLLRTEAPGVPVTVAPPEAF